MRAFRFRLLAAVVGLTLLGLPGGAQADEGESTHVDSVSASVSGTFVNVAGTATFVNVPAALGQDPTGDSTPVPGSDLTTLTIARPDPAANNLTFTLGIADQPPVTNGTPGVLYYNWEIRTLSPGGDSVIYVLQANRASGSQVPSTDPMIRVLARQPDGSCGCQVVANVEGKIADGVVQWSVPGSRIEADPGDTIIQDGNIVSTLGAGNPATGDTWFINLGGDQAVMDQDYVVPGPTVKLGIAPAGTPESQVPLDTTAAVDAATGNFDGAINTSGLAPGSYVVVARACYGTGNCGTASTTVTI